MEVVGASLEKLIAEATPLIPVQVLVHLVKDQFSILESQFLQAPEFVFAFPFLSFFNRSAECSPHVLSSNCLPLAFNNTLEHPCVRP